MQHGAKRSLCHFVFEDATAVVVGVAGMDHQRQADCARGRDMRAKTTFLRLARAVLVEVVQPGLAQRNDLWMLRQLNQLFSRNTVFLVCMVRMGADGAIDVRKTLRDCEQRIEMLHPRGDRDNTPYSGGLGARDNGIEVVGKIRKIEMAVAVDKHRFQPFTPLSVRCSAEKLRPAQAIWCPL